ncbi:hypothetical protein NP493_204g06068 [Ridgeia piscesae]|uniref:Uncharacterized protein n=1 Tax=Ridgeia piscesae TaxID=27915 RepID=A0AAD9UE63_RIDPI|nr:hypothetical protein NP493_204g06068 [Ridgeia piscesae]
MCNEVISWLDGNQQKELQKVYMPIITNLKLTIDIQFHPGQPTLGLGDLTCKMGNVTESNKQLALSVATDNLIHSVEGSGVVAEAMKTTQVRILCCCVKP